MRTGKTELIVADILLCYSPVALCDYSFAVVRIPFYIRLVQPDFFERVNCLVELPADKIQLFIFFTFFGSFSSGSFRSRFYSRFRSGSTSFTSISAAIT